MKPQFTPQMLLFLPVDLVKHENVLDLTEHAN